MSNRTSEANKAIEEAWEKEQDHVRQGEGTRDWTPDQQKDILEKGKAYDEKGKAYEGHHMKSVEAYPEHQGEAGNIQFLNRDEHKAAHNGNFQNATNGQYDPKTGETKKFSEASYKPCKAEKLSNPVAINKESNASAKKAGSAQESQAAKGLEEEAEQSM